MLDLTDQEGFKDIQDLVEQSEIQDHKDSKDL
jgi:hypothetical protein